MSSRARARARIEGVVQGVGFRWFILRTAQQYGLTGWVRNLSDGSVQVEAEGMRELVEAFLEQARSGPRFSRVTSVSVDWVTAQLDTSFEVKG